MSESGRNGVGQRDAQGGGGGGGGPEGPTPPSSHEPPRPDPRPAPPRPTAPSRRHLPRGVVIQLTGAEGGWDGPDQRLLVPGPRPEEEEEPCPLISLSAEWGEGGEGEPGPAAFHVPLSPSSPCSLGCCSPSGTTAGTTAAGPSGFLSPGPPSPTQRPALAGLVKSLSTELEPKEGSTLRARPLLSLVKSISTELSRSEPEVSQSKSDSRLNLHLLKQLAQPRGRGGGDSRTAPPSPGSLSPSGEGPRGSFFKLELEDTKKKLSEAMQEPLSSMLSKIRREESGGSPKHQWRAPQGACPSPGRGEGLAAAMAADAGAPQDSPLRSAKRADATDPPGAFDWPSVRPPRAGRRGACPVHGRRRRPASRPRPGDERPEIYDDDDAPRVVATEAQSPEARAPAGLSFGGAAVAPAPPPALPAGRLLGVAALSFLYLTLPLGPYLSGAGLGLAAGVLLGLLLIRLGSPRRQAPAAAAAVCRRKPSLLGLEMGAGPGAAPGEPDVLKGWMSETLEYDPETSHPALMAPVLGTLEGSSLRLETPRPGASRGAQQPHDEEPRHACFVRTRTFHLVNSKVFLLPSVLARKRLWNPKYPICIQLAEGAPSLGGGEATPPEPQEPRPTTLYLYGRTGREKEEWFHHFLSASQDGAGRERDAAKERPDARCVHRADDLSTPRSASPPGHGGVSAGASREGSTEEEEAPSSPPLHHHHHHHHPHPPHHHLTPPGPQGSGGGGGGGGRSLPDYPSYMARLLASAEALSPLPSPTVGGSADTSPTASGAGCTCDLPQSPAWVNALIGRIFWDVLRERSWSDAVSRKIQKKLSRIRLPYFMNELTLTELDMGSCMPQITAASRPEVNHRGLWVELEVVYTGALQLTLQTKFNLSKLGKEGSEEPCGPDVGVQGSRPVLGVLADSDQESSSAGSSDEEELLQSEPQGGAGDKGVTEGAPGGRKGRRILKFVDKIAKSKYFQKATENEFIRKKMEEMSNTPLLLTVEVQELSGTLVINIPAPPSDRIWYSLCMPPRLDLRVRPKLGEREVTFCHVTEWIERRLQQEFQKVFVLPNMDDIYVPLMHSGMDSPLLDQKLWPQSAPSSVCVDSTEKDPAEDTSESH